ncbi:MAG TPA: galactokinase [Acidimicrobiales bacterium]|nr:galactokinase [Acidimicrobiales bacterium]
MLRAHAPGRVNLIGDHTDYLGGLVLPMAIDLGTTIEGERGGDAVVLRSADEDEPAVVPIAIEDPTTVEPGWARYVAGVVAEVQPALGVEGTVATTLPIGAGLSSSAALEVAVALALGFDGSPLALAQTCQRAEQRATGVPSGIMDQLASAAGEEGHALLVDCGVLTTRPVAVPEGVEVVVVDSGEARTLVGSPYAERRAQAEQAEALIGPLREATTVALKGIDDELVQARARHVMTENARVWAFAEALEGGWLDEAGRLMVASHASLRDDYEVSTPTLDALVARLVDTPGVYGARLTGAGFGGCVVALTEPGALDEGWTVRAAAGASVSEA